MWAEMTDVSAAGFAPTDIGVQEVIAFAVEGVDCGVEVRKVVVYFYGFAIAGDVAHFNGVEENGDLLFGEIDRHRRDQLPVTVIA